MCPIPSLHSLLEDIYLLQIPIEQAFTHDKYKLLLENFTWKQISNQIESMNSNSRFYLRKLQFSFVSDYVLLQFQKMLPIQKKLWHNGDLETFFWGFDLLNASSLDLHEWKSALDSAEYSLRLQFSYHGIDLSNLSKKINNGVASHNDMENLFWVVHHFFFDELKILCQPTNFFKPSAHNIFQVLTGERNAISFNLALILLFLLLRLAIFTEVFYIEQTLVFKTTSHCFYFRMNGRIAVLNLQDVLGQNPQPLQLHSLLHLKISQMQALFQELENLQMQDYLVNLQKIIVS